MKIKLFFVLIGNNNSGKTKIQKKLIELICGEFYEKLPSNKIYDILIPNLKQKYNKIFFGNRSYQEINTEGKKVEDFFPDELKEADLVFVSSHLKKIDIDEIIFFAKSNFYNVIGLFLYNSIDKNLDLNKEISLLNWDKRIILENYIKADESDIMKNIDNISNEIYYMLFQ